MNEDNRDPLDPSRKFSEGGGQEHRWALGIDCPVCPSKAGAWCSQVSSRAGRNLREGGVELRDPPAKISTWNLHGARINQARDPEQLYAQRAVVERERDAIKSDYQDLATQRNELLVEITKLRAGLAEAIDLFDMNWCTEFGHGPNPKALERAAELRKLVKP